MSNRPPFAPNEWYHCYSRGVEKRKTFTSKQDYERFLQGLFLANSSKTIHRSDLKLPHEQIFEIERGDPLVAIGAYCLMPNHFHILIKEIADNGITTFMRSLGTAYAMYFNIRYKHVGNLFVKPFRSKHVSEDGYFNYVAQYIHLNPAEMLEPGWKEGAVNNMQRLEEYLRSYTYSSLKDYSGKITRPERAILNSEAMEFISAGMPPLIKNLTDAAAYYQTMSR